MSNSDGMDTSGCKQVDYAGQLAKVATGRDAVQPSLLAGHVPGHVGSRRHRYTWSMVTGVGIIYHRESDCSLDIVVCVLISVQNVLLSFCKMEM